MRGKTLGTVAEGVVSGLNPSPLSICSGIYKPPTNHTVRHKKEVGHEKRHREIELSDEMSDGHYLHTKKQTKTIFSQNKILLKNCEYGDIHNFQIMQKASKIAKSFHLSKRPVCLRKLTFTSNKAYKSVCQRLNSKNLRIT